MENVPLVITFLVAYLLGAGSILGIMACDVRVERRKEGRDD